MSSLVTDEFRVQKLFADNATPKFMKFKIGIWGKTSPDREHLSQLRYSSTKDGTPTTAKNSVVSTRWTKEGENFVDQEVTGYFYLPEIEPEGDKEEDVKFKRGGKGSSLTLKLRGGRHSKTDEEHTGKNYNFDFQYKGDKGLDETNNFQKEFPHPFYYKMSVDTKFKLDFNLKKWVGYKAVTINQDDGVRCLAFVDYGSKDRSKADGPDLEKQKWETYYDVTDDGKLHKKFNVKTPKDRPQYKDFPDIREPFKKHSFAKVTQFRMDRILKPEAKFLSARMVKRVSAAVIKDIVDKHLP